jgi:hypothetical protein
MREFSVKLFFFISSKYPLEWNQDWKNDVFLGQLCELTWRYDERYECYKRAYDRLADPPDSLLLLLAGCNSAPGTPPLNDQEAEKYLNQALKKRATYEAAIMMRNVVRHKNDQTEVERWNRLCGELKLKNVHVESIIPDIFSM